MRKLFINCFNLSIALTAAAVAARGIQTDINTVLFCAVPFIAGAFSDMPEVVQLGALRLRCMAFGIVPDVFASALMGYLQDVSSRYFLNAINIFDRLIAPIIAAVVLWTLFGSKGIMTLIAARDIIAYGRPKEKLKAKADYRLSLNVNTLCTTLRDLCEHFNHVEFYKSHEKHYKRSTTRRLLKTCSK